MIPDEAVRDMAAGSLPDSLGDEAIFAQAREAFGERGIADMILLAGSYHTVCGLLNAFDVPAPQAYRGQLGCRCQAGHSSGAPGLALARGGVRPA